MSFGLLGGVAQERDQVVRGLLTDASGAQSRFRFIVRTCETDSHHDNVCQGTFSRCHADPCPASKGQAELIVDADGSVFLVLVSSGQRLACTLVPQPGPGPRHLRLHVGAEARFHRARAQPCAPRPGC